jgi:hypothetical protein
MDDLLSSVGKHCSLPKMVSEEGSGQSAYRSGVAAITDRDPVLEFTEHSVSPLTESYPAILLEISPTRFLVSVGDAHSSHLETTITKIHHRFDPTWRVSRPWISYRMRYRARRTTSDPAIGS